MQVHKLVYENNWIIEMHGATIKDKSSLYKEMLSVQNMQSMNTYTGCPWRKVPDFVRVFLKLKYTDITQNTYIQSWTVTEIMAREKFGLLAVPHTVLRRALR
jgi:hypothetical protein